MKACGWLCALIFLLLCAALAPAWAGTITEVWRSPAGTFSPRALSVDAGDGSVWVADDEHSEVIQLAADGTELLRVEDIPGAIGIAANSADGSVWVIAYSVGEVFHLASDGSELWRGSGFAGFMKVSVVPTDGSVWLGGGAKLVHLAADGTEIGRYTHPSGWVALVSANPTDGSCWASILDTSTVVHVAADGTLLWRTDDMPGPGNVSVNPTDGSCWTCGGTDAGGGYVSTVVHFSGEGEQLWRRDGWWGPDGGPWVAVNPKDGSCWVVHNLHTTPHAAGVTLVGVDGTVRAQHLLGDEWICGLSSDHGDGSLWLALQNGFVVHLVAEPDGSPFWDVGGDHWAVEEITACAEAEIAGGYPDGCYYPGWPVTRGQMAVFVARGLAGGEEHVPAPTADPGFTDVDDTHWAYQYICYAVEQNIVSGYPEGDYRPAETVTRDQMAVYIARAMVAPTTSVLDDYEPAEPRDFPDVPSDHWAYTYIEYCVEQGVVGGFPEGDYRPTVVVTRDQMAVYVQRAFELPM